MTTTGTTAAPKTPRKRKAKTAAAATVERRSDDQQDAIERAAESGQLPAEDRRLADVLKKLSLRPGSSIDFLDREVRAKIAPVSGVHPTYVHGATLAEIVEQLP